MARRSRASAGLWVVTGSFLIHRAIGSGLVLNGLANPDSKASAAGGVDPAVAQRISDDVDHPETRRTDIHVFEDRLEYKDETGIHTIKAGTVKSVEQDDDGVKLVLMSGKIVRFKGRTRGGIQAWRVALSKFTSIMQGRLMVHGERVHVKVSKTHIQYTDSSGVQKTIGAGQVVGCKRKADGFELTLIKGQRLSISGVPPEEMDAWAGVLHVMVVKGTHINVQVSPGILMYSIKGVSFTIYSKEVVAYHVTYDGCYIQLISGKIVHFQATSADILAWNNAMVMFLGVHHSSAILGSSGACPWVGRCWIPGWWEVPLAALVAILAYVLLLCALWSRRFVCCGCWFGWKSAPAGSRTVSRWKTPR